MGKNSTFDLAQKLIKEEKKKKQEKIKLVEFEELVKQGPKKQTIDFILSYAKSIDIVKTKSDNILISLN
tara:strand:+ start:325 stop:531 length:207 start_codon:yes stop_codon:yes gene_type:complete